MVRNDIRNIAIIAHVDHGKTTLVDQMLRQGGIFRENQQVEERVMDSNDLERERGITILAKNTSCNYKGVKINIVDTPGHADFSGEVERVLKMVSGVLLLVDAYEGPMPQTRFVLQKALELNHKVIIVVNKTDRPDARVGEVVEETLGLLLDLNATDEQFSSPVIYCSGRKGTASIYPNVPGNDLTPLFDTIISHIDPPEGDETAPLQLLVSSIDYSDYVGRIGIGRIERGAIKVNEPVCRCALKTGEIKKVKIGSLYAFEGLGKREVDAASVGDIVCFSGVEEISIGDTISDAEHPEALKFVKITEPSVEMTFLVNNSPFAGREGKFVTSRHLRERLYRELLKDVSLKAEDTESADAFKVSGRGEMHLSILIENMRREGYEFQVSMPKVLFKTIDGKLCEPIERLVVDVPEDCVGTVINKMGVRKGELVHMDPMGGRMRVEFKVPARGLFGYKSEFLTDTRGEGVMNSVFDCYEPFKGNITRRTNGALIAHETGEAVTYGLYNAQERGTLFVGPGVKVYAGMVVGVSPKSEDIVVNVCKKKQASNMRASGSDEALRLVPCKDMSLEEALEFLADDEFLEVTPQSIRVRKIELDHAERARRVSRMKKEK